MEARSFHDIIVASGAAGLSHLYAAGKADAVEVTRLYLDRIAALDAELGAYVHVDRAGASVAAQASAARWLDGAPLSAIDGVPLAIKANIAVQGWPWHAGFGAYRDRVAAEDAACIARLRAAGAILLGLTNMHEGAAGATTDNPHFGRTHNPWRHGHTAAGSSGGSGAAVAAGLAAAALGTDTGGSVRLPSAVTGIFGLKPARGAISIDGVVPLSWTLDHVGVHGRSTADCALLHSVLTRADATGQAEKASRPLRFGVLDVASYSPIDQDTADALSSTVQRASAIGAEVETITFPLQLADFYGPFATVVAVEGSVAHGDLTDASEGVSDFLRAMLAGGAAVDAHSFAEATRALVTQSDAIRDRLAGFDALLTPALGLRPQSFDDDFDIRLVAFALLGNISGLPAIAFPAGIGEDGLPLSIQAICWNEATALRIADLLAQPVGAPPRYC